MRRINIQRKHTLGREKARLAVEELAAELAESLALSYAWQEDRLVFKRDGAGGEIEVTDTDVYVTIRLGLLFTPMKGMVENEIARYLDEHL